MHQEHYSLEHWFGSGAEAGGERTAEERVFEAVPSSSFCYGRSRRRPDADKEACEMSPVQDGHNLHGPYLRPVGDMRGGVDDEAQPAEASPSGVPGGRAGLGAPDTLCD